MPPEIVDIRAAGDVAEVARRAASIVAEGRLVVFPTETVYGLGARASDAEAVDRLIRAKNRGKGHPLTLAIRTPAEALDYAPDMSALAFRLARRCWPGPLTLVLQASNPLSMVAQFAESVQASVAPGDEIGLRVPKHDVILRTMDELREPLVLTSANVSGGADPRTAQEAVDSLKDGVDLVLDDGPVPYGRPSSVVRVREHGFEILREGVYTESSLRKLAARMILFVCTGNTCRSPLAEAICEKMLAERLGCDIDELEMNGQVILSAGLAAATGMPASSESVQVANHRGLSLADHQANPVNEMMIRYADRIYTMTQHHRRMILAHWPDAVDRVQMLSPEGEDIPDPIGGPLEAYEQCAQRIEEDLAKRLDEVADQG